MVFVNDTDHLTELMKKLLPTLMAALSGVAFLTTPAIAQVPQLLNYQGRVAVDAVNFEGAGQFRFALVDDTGATTFWSNDGTSAAGSEPTAAVSLPVGKGLYSVLLGDLALINMTAIPASVFTNPDVRLRVWFDDGVNGSQLLTPDQRIAPAPYLADGAVTSASVAAGAITGTHVAPGSLDFSHLTVLAAPSAGQVLGFDGASMNWVAPGGGVGGDVFSLNGTSAYYNGGKVGIGTSQPGAGLEVARGSLAITGINALSGALSRTGKGVFITTSGSEGYLNGIDFTTGALIPPSIPLILQSGTGGVGIGNGPRAGYRLEVGGAGVLTPGGSGGEIAFGTPNAETGMTIIGANRADLRFDGSTFKMVVGPVGGPPASTRGIAVTTAGNVGIGTTSPARLLDVAGDATMRDLSVRVLTIRGGADLAEPFAMSHQGVAPGMVVVIDAENPGKLRRSTAAYDRKVAGIVSGANGIHAGISMIDEQQLEAGENVALSGRVFVKANTSGGAIAPGDLLTTSDIPGEAMKAADHSRAQGAILGKAMTALSKNDGTVLVLVTLQ